jgi:hypothetical protein
MNRITSAALAALDTVLYLVELFFWTIGKSVAVLTAVGLVELITREPLANPAAVTVTVAVLAALDVTAWFLDREYQRRDQNQES